MSEPDIKNAKPENTDASHPSVSKGALQTDENSSTDQLEEQAQPATGLRLSKRKKAPDRSKKMSLRSAGVGATIFGSSTIIALQLEYQNVVTIIATVGLLVGLTFWLLPSRLQFLQNCFDHNGAGVAAHDLEKQNKSLIERLEYMEDVSWEIRESEEIHRSLAAAFGDVVMHRNSTGDIIFSNQHFETYFDRVTPLPDVVALTNNAGNADKNINTQEIEVKTKKGQVWFSWTNIAVRDPHTGDVGIRSVARDITERKTHEQTILEALHEAKIANEAKSRFLTMVSHEIRTPLNGVIGMAGLLKDTPLQSEQQTYVDAIRTSGGTLLTLIEDLLDSAQIETGTLELKKNETNIVSLVEKVAELLAPHAANKGILLASYVDPNIPETCIIDEGRFRQVLLNLAGNAVKFTQEGGVGIELELSTQKPDIPNDIRLRVSISDSGPGLSNEDQSKIFEEFVQSDNSLTREHGGAGLGLAISQRLIGLMGSEIKIDSEIGSGARFSFEIDVTTAGKFEPSVHSTEKSNEGLAIILPRSPARSALTKLAQSTGRQVTLFGSVDDYLATPKGRFDADTILVFQSDMLQRQLCGIDLRESHEKLNRIFLIGDRTKSEDTDDLKLAGYDGWLTWPVRSNTLNMVLDSNDIPTHTKNEAKDDLKKPEICLNILVAEDNPINALLAKSLLGKLGHGVCHVENGQAAFDAFKEQKFDLIFMDLHMPVMDGETSISSIRQHEKSLRLPHVPIVVLSADGQSDARANAIQVGADDYLTKPLDIDAVKKLVLHHSKAA